MMSHYPYEAMEERPDALERLDLRIRWGDYEIRVLRFHLTSFTPGKVVGFHKHDEFEFHFIPRGRGSVVIEDEKHELREGMFYLTGPGVMHYQEASAHEAMDELCLHIDIVPIDGGAARSQGDRWEQEEAADCVERLKRLPLYPALDIHGAMPCFLEAFQACVNNIVGSYTTIKHHVVQILLRAVRAYSSGPGQTDFPERDMKLYRYKLAMQFLRANYANAVTLADVADRMNISARQLQRILKEHHPDSSFTGLLEQIRLDAVCRRLVEGAQSIEQIALAEGFSSGNYLHLVFRKKLGMTPSQYRSRYAVKAATRS